MENEHTQLAEPKINRNERIASKIIRALAVTGLISILALVTWVVVQGIQYVPGTGENVGTVFSGIKGIFRKAPDETLLFELSTRTVSSGEQMRIDWVYQGEREPKPYTFSYSCASGAILEILQNNTWEVLDCDQPLDLYSSTLLVTPRFTMSQFTDVELTIKGNELTDSTSVTILSQVGTTATTTTATSSNQIEEDLTGIDPNKKSEGVSSDTTTKPKPQVTKKPTTQPSYTPTTPTPVPVQPTKTVLRPLYNGPADLVLNIEETGVMVKVAGDNTFFPVSPIPSNKVAGVKFTITNKGGVLSESWRFTAKLPVEGDESFEYTSPKQLPLASGMQMEFTLGFDEILEESRGTIHINLIPDDDDDNENNNTDSAVIKIDVEN